MLRTACRDAATWLDKGTVSVNFSAAQFRFQDLDVAIAKALDETDLPPERLEIEVPESLFLEHSPDIMATLNRTSRAQSPKGAAQPLLRLPSRISIAWCSCPIAARRPHRLRRPAGR